MNPELTAIPIFTPINAAVCYALLAAVNTLAAALRRRRAERRPEVVVAAAFAAVFLGAAVSSWYGYVPSLPEMVKSTIDWALSPATVVLAAIAVQVVVTWQRAWFARRYAALLVGNLAAGFVLLSMPDPHFAWLVTQPDNIAIVGLLFTLGYFLWLGLHLAVENDRRQQRSEPPMEGTDAEKERILVWPDLVYIELICMVFVTVGLLWWSLLVRAPLEAPANPLLTPNPAKAPWYFVGLQELLVFFDPWLAGVVYPMLIVLGLCAIPYLDRNPAGSGYYTCRERPVALTIFYFGFIQLWILLIVIGTFFRGPNWGFYGLYESWTTVQEAAHGNRTLAEFLWRDLAGVSPPACDADAGWVTRPLTILGRESFGLVGLAVWFIVIPVVAAKTWWRGLRRQMGRARYVVFALLLMAMLLVPAKMLCRWWFDMSYFVSLSQWGLHI